MGKQLMMRLTRFLHQKDNLALHWALYVISLNQLADVLPHLFAFRDRIFKKKKKKPSSGGAHL